MTVVLRRARSSLTCRCSGLGPPSRLCRGHQSTLLSNHRTHKRLQRIACRPNAILFSDPLPNQLCPLRVAGVVKQGVQLAGSPDDVVAMGGNGAGDTQSRQTGGCRVGRGRRAPPIGFPDRIARPVVPTPPWWTITADRGNSPENGAYSTAITPSGSEGGRLRGSLSTSTARRPSRSAGRAVQVKRPATVDAELPRVKTIGGGPSSRNRPRFGVSPVSLSRSKKGNPVMTVCGGQSGCSG